VSDEEKIRGDLIIWKQRFKREEKRPPTQEEIETKKRELISDLQNTEKKLFGDVVE